MRTGSVLVPRRTRKLSKAGWRRRWRSAGTPSRSRSAGVADDERAADDVGVAVQVLRRRVHDEVGAELERPLEVRRHERVVDGEQHAARGGRPRRRRDVEELEHRVGRRLDPAQARARPDRRGHGRRIARVDVGERRGRGGGTPCRTGGTCRRRGRRPRPRGRPRRTCESSAVVAASAGAKPARRRRPRATRGWPRARSASGCACASTRSPCARPGAFCAYVDVGRSASSPRRSIGSGAWPAWIASVSKRAAGVLRARLPRRASFEAARASCATRARPGTR